MAGDRLHAVRIDRTGLATVSGDPAAVFPWWSFTKTVIAACALRLAEDGRLDLDAPLPDRPYSTAHLLQHRAGVANYGGIRAYHAAVARGDPPWPRDRLLTAAGADRLLFAPGTGWAYSNIGYLFARERIETVSGRSLARLVHELVAAPLGLESVRLARGREDFGLVHWPAARRYDPGWVYPGCLTGTAADAVRLLDALMRGRLLRPESLRAMLARHPLGGANPGRPWTRTGYGLGLMSGEMGAAGTAVGHSGAGPFSVNAVYHFPDLPEPATIACFTDGTDEGVAEWGTARLAVAGASGQ